MDWTQQENVDRLGQYIDQGLSAGEAARKFGGGLSRSAVIGAATRQGWSFGRPRPKLPSLNALIPAPTEGETFPVERPACIATVEELAAALLDEHRIAQKALGPMLERVNADPDMRAQVVDRAMARLVEAECERVLQATMAQRHQAEKRRTGGGPLGARRATNVQAHAAAVSAALLDTFTLPGGKKLGDATRADLATAIAAFDMQATDATIKHRWLRLVQQSVQPGQTVREVLTEERVAELRDEARKGDA